MRRPLDILESEAVAHAALGWHHAQDVVDLVAEVRRLTARRCSVQDCKDPGRYVQNGIVVPGLRECLIVHTCMSHFPFLAAWQSMGDPIPGVDRRPLAVQRADAASMKRRRGGDLAAALDTVKQAELDVDG